MDNNNDMFSNPFDEDEKKNSTPLSNDSSIQPIDDWDASGRNFIWLILGVAAVVCGLFFAAALFFFQPDAQSLVDKYFPSPTATLTATRTPTPTVTSTPTRRSTPTTTATPTITPTPHVLLIPSHGEAVFEEPFDSNEQKWYALYENNTVLVKDGRLIIRSEEPGYIAVAFCTVCPSLTNTYYFQAELSTLKYTLKPYGLAFCSRGYGTEFYVFQINPETQSFGLSRHSAIGWESLIASKTSPIINRFPVTNTLGVYFDHGEMQLFVNNTLVNSYKDPNPFECRKSGFFVNSGKVDMAADNVFSYNIESTPTPAP